MPGATVIIVTHNSAPWIRDCLASITRQDYEGNVEIIVVDNASTDGTSDLVASIDPTIRLVKAANRGFGAGCNEGAGLASGEVLAFVNPDTVCDAAWLRTLLDAVAGNTIATSQVLLHDRPDSINTCGLTIHFTGLSTTRHYGEPRKSGPPFQVPGFSGCSFAVNRQDFEALGGFDEDIFLYMEDADLSWRARAAGFQIVCVPASIVWHDYRPDLGPTRWDFIRASRQLLVAKHLGRLQRLAWAPSLVLAEACVAYWGLKSGASRRSSRGRRIATPGRSTSPKPWADRTFPFAQFGGPAISAIGAIVNTVFLLNTLTWRKQ